MRSVLLFIVLSAVFCYAVIHFEWGVAHDLVQPNFRTESISFSRS